MVSEMQVVWTAQAKITYLNVLDYLSENWTQREMVQFTKRREIVLRAIEKNLIIFASSLKHKAIRRAVIDKNNSCFYTVDQYNMKIFLITFFDNRQNNTEKLKFEPKNK